MTKKQIKGLNLEELIAICSDNGFSEFRAKQIYQCMYRHGIMDIKSMNNIPNDMKSIALNVTIQSMTKTLEDKDLEKVNKLIIDTVENKTGAKIRS